MKLISITNNDKHNIFNFLGIKIKIKDKNRKIKEKLKELGRQNANLKNTTMVLQTHILDNLIREQIKNLNNQTYKEFIDNLFNKEDVLLVSWAKDFDNVMKYYPALFKGKARFLSSDKDILNYRSIFWGTNFKLADNVKLLNDLVIRMNKYTIAEQGFIHIIATKTKNPEFRQSISFMFDDIAPYYDARFPNRLEQLLNDTNLIITEEQKQRARKCIDKIIETHLTKYNHQPIYTPEIGRKGAPKVLVIDQSYGDMSISKGLANDNTFKIMLETAINENPDADIIVKIHPDTINGHKGYYSNLCSENNIIIQSEAINPISIIKYVDKIYVCTSQFGFEALMCNKEVHVFGAPFYANWGLTHDYIKCERRNNIRSIEEIFYITYIMYTYYVNPETGCRCEIEEAIEYLLKMRDKFFNQ